MIETEKRTPAASSRCDVVDPVRNEHPWWSRHPGELRFHKRQDLAERWKDTLSLQIALDHETSLTRCPSKCKKSERAVSWNVRGPQGVVGSPGTKGPPGPFPGVLPRGITVHGNWAGGSSTSGTAYESISFGFTFASAPAFHYVPGPASVPAGCSGGTNANPTAQPGNLCLYSAGWAANTTGAVVTGAPNRWGTLFTLSSISSGFFADGGTWAATSP